MVAVENEPIRFDSLFALVANSKKEEDDKVCFLNVQKNLKIYSHKESRSLAKILINAYYVIKERGSCLMP